MKENLVLNAEHTSILLCFRCCQYIYIVYIQTYKNVDVPVTNKCLQLLTASGMI